jgi:hypothetical protein
MAKTVLTPTPLKEFAIGDMLLLQFGYETTEHEVVQVSSNMVKFKPRQSCLGSWIEKDSEYIKDVITPNDTGPWKNIEGSKSAPSVQKRSFWRKVYNAFN